MCTYDWQTAQSDIFWGEVADCDHIVQIYETDEILIDALAGFIITGVKIDDCCIIIATRAHLKELHSHLKNQGLNVDTLIADGKYQPYVAEELLPKFMVNDSLDEKLFIDVVSDVVATGRKTKRVIRLFGEMSALLWMQGHKAAALHIEHLGTNFCQEEAICIFCAYSKEIFTEENISAVHHVCIEHSTEISGTEMQLTEIYYKAIA